MFTRLTALALFAIAVASPALSQPIEVLRQPGYRGFDKPGLCPTSEAAFASVIANEYDSSCSVLPTSIVLEGISTFEEGGAMVAHFVMRQATSLDGAGLPTPDTIFYPVDVYAPVQMNPDAYVLTDSLLLMGDGYYTSYPPDVYAPTETGATTSSFLEAKQFILERNI